MRVAIAQIGSVVLDRSATLAKAAKAVREAAGGGAELVCFGEALVPGYPFWLSRVDAAKIAVEKAGDKAAGAVLASDAFFPFADGIEAATRAGVTAVIQPGGSKRDSEVVAAADAANVAMVFTGRRHFRH